MLPIHLKQNSVMQCIKLISSARNISILENYAVRCIFSGSSKLKLDDFEVIRRTKWYPLTTRKFDQSLLCKKIPHCYSTTATESDLVDPLTFERACEETLQSLSEYFEELVEKSVHLQSADISYSSGVLTVNFGSPYGTYVINRQTPNRQIWLSSPTTGPKRYDFVTDGEYWIYKHDGRTLHQLLQSEIPAIIRTDVDFSKCSYCRL